MWPGLNVSLGSWDLSRGRVRMRPGLNGRERIEGGGGGGLWGGGGVFMGPGLVVIHTVITSGSESAN